MSLRWSHLPSFLLLALLTACQISAANARDLFVDNVLGDDRNNGSSPHSVGANNGPFRSLVRALEATRKGDRVILAPGEPYRECVTLQGARHSGFASHPFEIVGNGAVLSGYQEVNERDWEPVIRDVYRVRPPRLAHQTFSIDDQPATRAKVDFAGLTNLPVKQWALLDGFIYFRTEKERPPYLYAPRYGAHGPGLTLYDVSHVLISGLRIEGYQLDGVNAHDNVRYTTLEEVTCEHNGRSGFSIGGSSRVHLIRCSAAGNGVAQVRTEGFCVVEVTEGGYDDATAPNLNQQGGRVNVTR